MKSSNNQFSNLVDVMMHFSDKETCKAYLAKMRWNGNPVCPHCGHSEKIYVMKNGYKCSDCRKPFSVTKGTIFENSPIPLQKWFAAIWLITSHKKGISSLQLHRDIGLTQKTAWFMLQRIRFAVRTKTFNQPLKNHVEADDCFIGGKNKNRHSNKKVKKAQGRSLKDKTPVLGLVERNGRVVAMRINDTSKKTIHPIILQNVCPTAKLSTDEWWGYRGLASTYSHGIVKHRNGEYVLGEVHTNTIEGFWSLLKRGIIGIYHQVSEKHLDKYLDEFEYRYNTKDLSDSGRFSNMLQLSNTRLKYADLIS